MTRYWFTQHWPHPSNARDDVPWNIYLQLPHKKRGEEITVGDKVVFYETAEGKAHLHPGDERVLKFTNGRKGAVGVAEVAGLLRSRQDATVFKYTDGTEMNWAWELPCHRHEWGPAVVPVEDVLQVLGRGTIRIARGLIEIEKSSYDELRRRMGI